MLDAFFAGFREAVHPDAPLQGDAGSFDRLKKSDGEDEGEREPHEGMKPIRRAVGNLNGCCG